MLNGIMSQQEKRECKVSTQDISGARSVEYIAESHEQRAYSEVVLRSNREYSR